MQNNEAFIAFDNVSKSYDGESYVVYNLNLPIRQHEFVSLLGPSGSGKTTSLMMLAGFEAPSKGEIMLDGKPLSSLPPHKRDIGMVFQNYALFPHMTIAENVAFPLSVRGVSRSKQKEKVGRALEMVELSHVAKRRPAQLSGGQQQRVALARALVYEPRVVLMDEPLGALDKRLRENMQQEIKRLHRELDLTVVYVTHDQEEALTMSDRVAVFYDGRIQQIATPKELYEQPHNAFVANFVGENNNLRGVIESVNNEEALMRLADGSQIMGRCHPDLSPGAEAMLALRPERVCLNADITPEDNRLRGQVSHLVYHGDHVRVRVKLDSGDELLAKLPNIKDNYPLPAVGSEVHPGWVKEDCRILPPMLKQPSTP